MQLSLPLRDEPWLQPSGVPPEQHSDAPILFVRRRHARRYVLRVGADGAVRVTIPRGGSRREADAFVIRIAAPVDDQHRRLAQPDECLWRANAG